MYPTEAHFIAQLRSQDRPMHPLDRHARRERASRLLRHDADGRVYPPPFRRRRRSCEP